MVRCILPFSFLVSSMAMAATSAPPTWNKNFAKDFKNKTFQQAFCEKSAGYQTQALCDHLKKNKSSLTEKSPSVSVQGNVLTLQEGRRTVEIKRTGKELQFEINRKVVDFSSLRSPAELLAALNKTLPRVASTSLWMNAAHAQEETDNYSTMVRMSAFIMSSTVDQGLCDSARKFIAACAGNIDDAPEATQYKLSYERFKADKIKSSDDDYLRWLLADTNELVVHLYKMEEIVKGLDKKDVRDRLRSCPSSIEGNTGKADSDMDLCGKALGELKGLIRAEGKNAEKLKEVLEKREKAATSLESVAGKTNPIVPPKNSSENIR